MENHKKEKKGESIDLMPLGHSSYSNALIFYLLRLVFEGKEALKTINLDEKLLALADILDFFLAC